MYGKYQSKARWLRNVNLIPQPRVVKQTIRQAKEKDAVPNAPHSYLKERHENLVKHLHLIANPADYNGDPVPAPHVEDSGRQISSVVIKYVSQGLGCGPGTSVGAQSFAVPFRLAIPLGACSGQNLLYYTTNYQGNNGNVTGNEGNEHNYQWAATCTLGTSAYPSINTTQCGRTTAIEVRMQFNGPPATATGSVYVAKTRRFGQWGRNICYTNTNYRGSFNAVITPTVSDYEVYSVAEIYAKGGLVLKYHPRDFIEMQMLQAWTPDTGSGGVALDPQTSIPVVPSTTGTTQTGLVTTGVDAIPWASIWIKGAQTGENVNFTITHVADVDFTTTNQAQVAATVGRRRVIGHPGMKGALEFMNEHHTSGGNNFKEASNPSTSTGYSASVATGAAVVADPTAAATVPAAPAESFFDRLKNIDQALRTEARKWSRAVQGKKGLKPTGIKTSGFKGMDAEDRRQAERAANRAKQRRADMRKARGYKLVPKHGFIPKVLKSYLW